MTPQPHNSPRSSLGTTRKSTLDPDVRRRIYGHVRPMDCDMSWWERLFRR